MRSCLEKLGEKERISELQGNEYISIDQYNVKHKNALSDGDSQGKGTGSNGHLSWKPEPINVRSKNVIDYSNFNTFYGGNCIDEKERLEETSSNLYNDRIEYSKYRVKGFEESLNLNWW